MDRLDALFTAFGIFVLAAGMVLKHRNDALGWVFEHHFQIPIVGALITFAAILGWALEGPGGYHLHPDESQPENES